MPRAQLTRENPGLLTPIDDESDDPARDRIEGLMQARGMQHSAHMGAVSLQLRARQQMMTEELARSRIELAHQNLELNQRKAEMEMQKQRIAMETQLKAQEHTVAALDAATKLSPSDPDYGIKLAEIVHANPMARSDKFFQEFVKSQIADRHTQQESQAHILEAEEKKAVEKEAAWGVEIPFNEKTGRRDFEQGMINKNLRDQEAQARAAGQVDPALKPSETTIAGGKVTQRFKAPAPDKPPAPDVTETETKPDPNGGDAIVTTKVRHVGGPVAPVATPPPVPRVKLKFDNGNLVPAE